MKKIFLLCILVIILSISTSYSQSILNRIKEYDIVKIENSAIKRTKKRVKINNKTTYLSAFSYFRIDFINRINLEKCSTGELLSNIKLVNREPISFVVDDSLRLISTVAKKNVVINHNPELSKEYMYIRFFYKFKPDYIFEIATSPIQNPLFLCYKNKNLYIVYLSNDRTKIISYSLSEFSDCRLLYININDWNSILDENSLPRLPE